MYGLEMNSQACSNASGLSWHTRLHPARVLNDSHRTVHGFTRDLVIQIHELLEFLKHCTDDYERFGMGCCPGSPRRPVLLPRRWSDTEIGVGCSRSGSCLA